MLGDMNETQLLPNDLASCQTIIVEQGRAMAEQKQKITEQSYTLVEQAQAITELHQKVQEQELMINELLQRAYRNRSERYREDPNQLKIDFGNTPEAADAADGFAAFENRGRNATRLCLPICRVAKSCSKYPMTPSTARRMASGS